MHWLLILFLSFAGVSAHSNVKCSDSFIWAYNSNGYSPCDVASSLIDVCTPGGEDIQPLSTASNSKSFYAPELLNITQTPCVCNSVTYSLLSACGLCQGKNYTFWSAWVHECGYAVWHKKFPESIPHGLDVPVWAYLDVSTSDAFDDTLARTNATVNAYSDVLKAFNIQFSVIVLSGIAFGIVIVLSLNCGYETIKSEHIQQQTRGLLFIYVVFMSLLSTVAFLEVVIYLWSSFLENGIGKAQSILYFAAYSIPTPLPFLILGADGFMIYRCQALYHDVSRAFRFLLLSALLLLFLALCGTGVLFFFLPGRNWCGIILPTSTFVNIILSLLIAFRTLHLQRHNRKAMGTSGDDNSPYSRIMTICLEPSALMILSGAIILVLLIYGEKDANNQEGLLKVGGWILVPLMVFPHICVISPLLISYRVAHGRDVTTLTYTPLRFLPRKSMNSFRTIGSRHMFERQRETGPLDEMDQPDYARPSRQSSLDVFTPVSPHGRTPHKGYKQLPQLPEEHMEREDGPVRSMTLLSSSHSRPIYLDPFTEEPSLQHYSNQT